MLNMAKKTPSKRKPNPWGDKLREVRALLSLDRQQAADMIGVSLRTLISWETGQYTPSRMAQRGIRDAFPDARFPKS